MFCYQKINRPQGKLEMKERFNQFGYFSWGTDFFSSSNSPFLLKCSQEDHFPNTSNESPLHDKQKEIQ